jgi:hypothetical protein
VAAVVSVDLVELMEHLHLMAELAQTQEMAAFMAVVVAIHPKAVEHLLMEQSALFGPVHLVNSHQQTQVTCNETLY